MKQKVLGLDLGTNSIGISVRNTQKTGSVADQLEYFSTFIFPSGVGKDNGKEFSYAAQRTQFRSARRLYQSRRYRIWSTLELLIENNCCPLTMEQLDAWRTYDKSKELFRHYPIEAKEFEQWVRLDFNNDGIPEYSSPYQLRAELMTRQFDFNNQIERYKLGRALYHIAQRRGFKSSKGNTLQEQEKEAKGNDFDLSNELKKSEIKKSKGLVAYMEEHNCSTVGCAFYDMEKNGIRVRANEQMQAIRSMYEDEICQIFTFQNGLSLDSTFFKRVISRKKGEGTIFYKRPLRSQKGNVGKCTLEKNKSRCPISRPEFEQFRAWAFINNLRYKTVEEEKAQRELPIEIREKLYEEKFVRVSNFKVADILKWLQKQDSSIAELNYDAQTSVMGSPVCARLKDILGDNWQTAELEGYNYEELWHVCFEVGDDGEEFVKDFAVTHLQADGVLLNKMMKLWGNITQDYASLSLKAIRNILKMLQEGYIYSEAVVLAKLPDLFGENWHVVKDALLAEWKGICARIEHERQIAKLTNNLIAEYKILEPEDQFAFHNTEYLLDDSDRKQVRTSVIKSLSYKYWKQLSESAQKQLLTEVENAYQSFFRSSDRNYCAVRHLDDAMLDVVRDNFMDYVQPQYKKKIENNIDVLYHPSDVAIYAPVKAKNEKVEGIMRNIKLFKSPATNVFRNPVVMRVLYQLRNTLNKLIKDGIIDDADTSVVVETARELNSANMREAIRRYQQARERENESYRKELEQHFPSRNITQDEIDKVRLWHEQGERCIYTGVPIPDIKTLLNNDEFEVEHTIPRSISFDDSLANKTICAFHYNRYVKKNLFPSQLPEEDYAAILERLEPWKKKIKALKKEDKDSSIVARHIRHMELRYWEDKVSRFTTQADEWKQSFRNNQLNDTRIITKYAYHFLKTVFGDVTVQRGEMTADFRKALGIQSLEEKKDRSLHSHHAIDATMLTLIPSNSKRDALLELFFQIDELKKRRETDASVQEQLELLEKQYNKLLASCDIKGVEKVPEFINRHILVQQHQKDQTLTPAHRRLRVRGKVVKKNGKERWITGDSLRGSLHQDTFYGAIAPAVRDENNKMIRDGNGKILVDEEQVAYVIRVPLRHKVSSKEKGFSTWDDLEKVIVDKDLFQQLKNQYPLLSFKEACEQGLCRLDRHGNRINQIRHVRCYVPSVKNPLPIKKQTYLSDKPNKQSYWAAAGDACYLCKYQSADERYSHYKMYNLYEIGKNRSAGMEAVPRTLVNNKGIELHLVYTLRNGLNVLIYKDSPEELRNLSKEEQSKRLYVIRGFETPSRINMVYHLSAKSVQDLGKGESIKDYDHLPEKIRCGAATVKFLIEHEDFDIKPKIGIDLTKQKNADD